MLRPLKSEGEGVEFLGGAQPDKRHLRTSTSGSKIAGLFGCASGY